MDPIKMPRGGAIGGGPCLRCSISGEQKIFKRLTAGKVIAMGGTSFHVSVL
jgi:hypothetical protein